MGGRPILIRLAYSLEPIWLQFDQLLLAFLAAIPIALAGAGFAGYNLARRALQPLARDDPARRRDHSGSTR